MKKLMFVAALAAAMTGLADVEGANIVGYQDISRGEVKQPWIGFTFLPVSGATTVKLSAVTVKDGDSSDQFQLLNPETLASDKTYRYFSDEEAKIMAAEDADAEDDPEHWQENYEMFYEIYKADVGWWNVDTNLRADNDDIDVGAGFLGLSPNRNNMKFVCSGEAPTTPKSFTTAAVKSPTMTNFLPVDCYLKDILIENGDSSDQFQVINPETLASSKTYRYFSDEEAKQMAAEDADAEDDPEHWQENYEMFYEIYKADIGWWNVDTNLRADNDVWHAGEALLGLSPSRNACKICFKGVLDVTPVTEEE